MSDRDSFEPRARSFLAIAACAELRELGDDALEAGLLRLERRDAEALRRGRVGPEDWLPLSAFRLLLTELEDRAGGDGIARHADAVLPTSLPSWVASAGTVDSLLASVTAGYRRIVDRGMLHAQEVSGGAIFRLVGVPEAGGALCRWRRAFFCRLFEAAGAREVYGAHPTCMGAGGAWCEFRINWSWARRDAAPNG